MEILLSGTDHITLWLLGQCVHTKSMISNVMSLSLLVGYGINISKLIGIDQLWALIEGVKQGVECLPAAYGDSVCVKSLLSIKYVVL